jgi:hypothetical protein
MGLPRSSCSLQPDWGGKAMNRNKSRAALMLSAAGALMTAGCGGGGGSAPPSGGDGVVVGPPPSSGPPPTLPPPAPAPIFGALGQTASQQFVTLGFSYRGRDGGFGLDKDPKSGDITRSIGLRFAAPSELLLSIGSFGEAALVPDGSSGQGPAGPNNSAGIPGTWRARLAVTRAERRRALPYEHGQWQLGEPTNTGRRLPVPSNGVRLRGGDRAK